MNKKKDFVDIATNMGFKLDYDQWEDKGWMRFTLPEKLDEPDMRWIIYNGITLPEQIGKAADILFKAGQKQKAFQLHETVKLSDI